MIYLIRTIEKQQDGSLEQRDTEYSGDEITIGRAADLDIQLMDSEIELNHARIKLLGNDRGHIKALSSAHPLQISEDLSAVHPLLVSEVVERNFTLKAGDSVSLGGSKISVIKSPAGFDFALTLERGEHLGVNKLAASQFVTSLSETSLFKRGWSWLFFVLILISFLILPVGGIFNDTLQDLLRSTPLPDDSSWNPGHLIPAHSEIESNCDNCHVEPFKVVQNAQCLRCHKEVRQHTNPDIEMAVLSEAMCSTCHMQHKEPSIAVTDNENLCINCHENLSATVSQTDLADASDFGANHPEFKITMLSPDTSGDNTQWKSVRVAQSSKPQEKSNLKFPHDMHLEEAETADGLWLECSSCHTLDDSGLLMKTVTMKDACHDCHTLKFDDDNPDRQVPHSSPAQVILSLQEYYARVYLENATEDTDVLELAKDSAEKTATDMFEKTPCKLCHEITVNDEVEDLLSRWSVSPVKLTSQWLPNHQFNHDDHKAEECSTCHDAEISDTSTDVLIPEITVCRDCHNTEDGQLNTTCAACHSFHSSDVTNVRLWSQ